MKRGLRRIGWLALVALIAVVVIAHAYRPPGRIQLLANGVPCANLRGTYFNGNAPATALSATTDPNGVLILNPLPKQAEAVFVTLKDSAGRLVWSGFISVPERASSVEVDIKRKRSETVAHKLYLNFGIFSIKTEDRTVWQQH